MNNPTNEMETIIWFVERQKDYGLDIVKFRPNIFPDATVIDITTGFPREVEFEYLASSFIQHEHDPFLCDLIVCWKNDFPIETTFPIFELSTNTLFGEVPSHSNRDEIHKYIRTYMQNREVRKAKRVGDKLLTPTFASILPNDWRKVLPLLSWEEIVKISKWKASDLKRVAQEQGKEERTLINWRTYAKREVEMKNNEQ